MMKTLALDPEFSFFHFDGASMPALDVIKKLIDEAWRHDYGKRGEVIFKYDLAHLAWLFQPGAFDAMWATTSSGEPAALMVLTKRTLVTRGVEIPAHYATLMTVGPRFRKNRLARRMTQLFYEKVVEYKSGIFGVLDGDTGGKRVFESFIRAEFHDPSNPYRDILSRPYTIWAACADVALINKYMPLPPWLAKIALHPWVRRLIEFALKPRHSAGHQLSYASPGVHPKEAKTWCQEHDMDVLYGSGHLETAGTRRVTFSEGAHCDISYSFHKVTKDGLPDTQAGHLQLICGHGVTSAQTRHAIQVVTHELMQRGAIAVTTHHTGMATSFDLLRAGFLPSERKIRYCFGWFAATGAECELEEPFFLDLI